jgi:hypothetical protein
MKDKSFDLTEVAMLIAEASPRAGAGTIKQREQPADEGV